MKKGDKIAIVCCSDGQPRKYEDQIKTLVKQLRAIGLTPVFSDYIYEQDTVASGTGKQRAESLMNFYREGQIKGIFDISGGDLANEILPFLDFSVIGQADKMFWGYSDLTTVINAIYTKTGRPSVLYQLKNLVRKDGKRQMQDFTQTVLQGGHSLYTFSGSFIQQEEMQGIVVGGNIRCLLKLAGTPYWPDMQDKILMLESLSGTMPEMASALEQLGQIGVYEQTKGIILGTFTRMEEENALPTITELVKSCVGAQMPVVKTDEIGHGADSKAILIGENISVQQSKTGLVFK